MTRCSVSWLVWLGIRGGRRSLGRSISSPAAQDRAAPAVIGRRVDPEDAARLADVAELRRQAEQPQAEAVQDVIIDHGAAPPAHRFEHDKHGDGAVRYSAIAFPGVGRTRLFKLTELPDFFDGSVIAKGPTPAGTIGGIFVIDGSNFFELYCGLPACSDDALKGGAQLIAGRLP